jgi:cyclopropane fatty-acyl-phospholipid synthase-like methyltransferase
MLLPSLREQRKLDRMIGPLGHWEAIKEYQISLLKKMGLQPHHTLLDIGCGPLSGGLAFIPYLEPGNYFGVDLRKAAIAEAKVQVEKAGLAAKKPVLVVSDSFGARELDGTRFDFIWASQITYHLDARLLESCLEWVSACLKPGGRFLADFISIPALVTPEKRWYEYSFHYHTIEAIGDLCDKLDLTFSNLGAIESFGYPVDWDFKHNYLLEFRKVSSQEECL